MSNVVTTLLDFILDLLRDEEKAAEYHRDPQGAIDAAGLQGVTPADVSASYGMVADCSPVRGWEGNDHGGEYHPHPRGVDAYHRPHDDHDYDEHDYHKPHAQPAHRDECDDDHKPDHKPWDDHHNGQEFAVIQHVQHIENDITITQIDASHSVWVNGDVNLLFGDDNVLQTGNGVLLNDVDAEKGGSIAVDNSHVDVDVEDSFNGSFNSAGDGGIAGGSNNSIDNSQDNDVNSDNTGSNVGNLGASQIGDNIGSGNSDSTVNAAGGDQHVGDEVTVGDIDVDIKDNQVALGNGNQLADDGGQNADEGGVNADDGAHVINDSFNPEDSFNDPDVDVHFDDINVASGSPGAIQGNDLSIEDSGNGNDFAGGDIDESHDIASDNAIAVHDAVAVTDPDLELGLVG